MILDLKECCSDYGFIDGKGAEKIRLTEGKEEAKNGPTRRDAARTRRRGRPRYTEAPGRTLPL